MRVLDVHIVKELQKPYAFRKVYCTVDKKYFIEREKVIVEITADEFLRLVLNEDEL